MANDRPDARTLAQHVLAFLATRAKEDKTSASYALLARYAPDIAALVGEDASLSFARDDALACQSQLGEAGSKPSLRCGSCFLALAKADYAARRLAEARKYTNLATKVAKAFEDDPSVNATAFAATAHLLSSILSTNAGRARAESDRAVQVAQAFISRAKTDAKGRSPSEVGSIEYILGEALLASSQAPKPGETSRDRVARLRDAAKAFEQAKDSVGVGEPELAITQLNLARELLAAKQLPEARAEVDAVWPALLAHRLDGEVWALSAGQCTIIDAYVAIAMRKRSDCDRAAARMQTALHLDPDDHGKQATQSRATLASLRKRCATFAPASAPAPAHQP